jgi:hypothetical protein
MIDTMETLLAACLGFALAAACGLRVFLPLFALSLASRFGWVEVTGGFAWVSGTPALVAFGVALALEVTAYYVPWLDNLLDAAAAPLAVGAGILVAAAVLTDVPPLVRWSVAIVAGGGAAAGMQGLTTVARAFTSFATAGLGNFVVATGELLFSGMLTVVAFVLPLLAAAIAFAVVVGLTTRLLLRKPSPIAA